MTALLAAAAVGGVVLVGARAIVATGPRTVHFIYVREENSLGLDNLPPPGGAAGSYLDSSRGVVTLPPGSDPVSRGTGVLVLRETFAGGALVEVKVLCLDGLSGVVAGRQGPGAPPECALLAVDLSLSPAGSAGSGKWSIRVETPVAPAAVLDPGKEWRLAAVRRDGEVVLFDGGDPGFAAEAVAAFADGRPVSLLSVVNYGAWEADRIELSSYGG